jgi:hypothetical protein
MRTPIPSILGLALLCCCPLAAQHFYYTPNTINNPVLQQKGDATASFGMAWGSDYLGLEAQGTWSPAKHMALMINAFATDGSDIRKDVEEGSAYRFLELGVGLYHKLERGTASIFAGVGQGNLYSFYGNNNTSEFTTRRFFLQPGLMYQDQLFRCGLALRLSRLSYPKGTSAFDIDANELAAIMKIEEDAPFFLPELGITGSLVLSPCVLSANLSTVFPDAPVVKFSRFNMNLMLTLELGQLKKKSKKG